jgi:flagellar biogenesis protein FliO
VKRLVLVLAVMAAMLSGLCAEVAAEPATGSGKTIPYKKEEMGATTASGQAFAIVTVLLGIACAGLVVAKRYFPRGLDFRLPLKPGASRRLQLVETMRLDARTSLYLVQLDDRVLLLAQSGDSVTPLVNERTGGHARNQEVGNHG